MNCEALRGDIEVFTDAPDNANFNPRMKSCDEENDAPDAKKELEILESSDRK